MRQSYSYLGSQKKTGTVNALDNSIMQLNEVYGSGVQYNAA